MRLFSPHQKRLANRFSATALEYGYQKSNDSMQKALQSGDMKWLKQEMRKHNNYEKALLYQQAPKRKKAKK